MSALCSPDRSILNCNFMPYHTSYSYHTSVARFLRAFLVEGMFVVLARGWLGCYVDRAIYIFYRSFFRAVFFSVITLLVLFAELSTGTLSRKISRVERLSGGPYVVYSRVLQCVHVLCPKKIIYPHMGVPNAYTQFVYLGYTVPNAYTQFVLSRLYSTPHHPPEPAQSTSNQRLYTWYSLSKHSIQVGRTDLDRVFTAKTASKHWSLHSVRVRARVRVRVGWYLLT